MLGRSDRVLTGCAGFADSLQGLTRGLYASSVKRTAGAVSTHGAQAEAPVTSVYGLPGGATWTVSTQIDLSRHSGKWLVNWSPEIVAPGLKAGQELVFAPVWGPRAQILGAGGAPLTVAQPQVDVGIEGTRINDRASLSKLLVASGATQSSVSAALAAGDAHPTFFEPVFDLSPAAYQALGGDTGPLHQAPGTAFRHTTTRGR